MPMFGCGGCCRCLRFPIVNEKLSIALRAMPEYFLQLNALPAKFYGDPADHMIVATARAITIVITQNLIHPSPRGERT